MKPIPSSATLPIAVLFALMAGLATATDAEPTGAIDPTHFVTGALVGDVRTDGCALSGGTETTCHRLTIAGVPADAAVGPFCPETVETDAANAGIWLDGSGPVHDADGAFIVDLPTLYDDSNWQLFDEATRDVRVTDTRAACEAAARPDVDPEYRNHSVECSLDDFGGGV